MYVGLILSELINIQNKCVWDSYRIGFVLSSCSGNEPDITHLSRPLSLLLSPLSFCFYRLLLSLYLSRCCSEFPFTMTHFLSSLSHILSCRLHSAISFSLFLPDMPHSPLFSHYIHHHHLPRSLFCMFSFFSAPTFCFFCFQLFYISSLLFSPLFCFHFLHLTVVPLFISSSAPHNLSLSPCSFFIFLVFQTTQLPSFC